MTLVMLPVAALSLLAGSTIHTHRAAAAGARSVDREVATLSKLIALQDVVYEQSSALSLDIRVVQFGLAVEMGKQFVGFDWGAAVPLARRQAQNLTASLGNESPVDGEALRVLVAHIDGGAVSPSDAQQRFADLSMAIDKAIVSRLDRLEAEDRNRPLTSALESLREATVLVDSDHFQIVDLTTVLFPLPADGLSARAALVRLAAARATSEQAEARLRSTGVDRVVGLLDRIEADPEARAFEQAVTMGLAGAPAAAALEAPADASDAQNSLLGKALHGYFVRHELSTAFLRQRRRSPANRHDASPLPSGPRICCGLSWPLPWRSPPLVSHSDSGGPSPNP